MSVRTDFAGYKNVQFERQDETGLRVLTRDFKIIIDGQMLTIPKGFETDLSSIPWLFRFIVRFDRVDVAGVVHDYLYKHQYRSRRESDRIWRLVAQHGEYSANFAQAWICWFGLRLGGWWQWNKRKKQLKQK